MSLEESSSSLDSDNSESGDKEANQNIPETSDFSNWYTLRVVSGKEKFVKENIFRELEFSPDLKTKINEIFVPFEKIIVIKNDKKKIKERMFFPGYIMINMLMDVESKYFVEFPVPYMLLHISYPIFLSNSLNRFLKG